MANVPISPAFFPTWIRHKTVQLAMHTNHLGEQGSRPWILSLSLFDGTDQEESWQLCIWHHYPEPKIELYKRGDDQRVQTREEIKERLCLIAQHHECEHCKPYIYNEDNDVELPMEVAVACRKELEKDQERVYDESYEADEHSDTIFAYLMHHWNAIQLIVQPHIV